MRKDWWKRDEQDVDAVVQVRNDDNLDEGGGRGDRKTQCIREIFGMQVEDRH
jgi:hypothetical protein